MARSHEDIAHADKSLVPMALYTEARKRLLSNAPLRDHPGLGSAPADELTATEIAGLQSVGLSPAELGDQDPLAQSVADYMALLSTSLTTNETADYLKVDASRVRQRLREGSLFGIDYGRERRLPKFQFERGHVLPGLGEVLGALPADLNPLDVAEWFLAPHPDLETDDKEAPVSPRDWLLAGRAIQQVVVLALGF